MKHDDPNRAMVAEFHKNSNGRFELFSLTAFTSCIARHDGKTYVPRYTYDVDYSREYGYIFHRSGGGRCKCKSREECYGN